MPKMKTHKGMRKRVKTNAAGKFFLQKGHRRHLMKNKSKKSKAAFLHGKPVSSANLRHIQQLLHS